MKRKVVGGIISLMCMLLPMVQVRARTDFSIYELRCEQKINPVGISMKNPRFSWKIEAQSKGFHQTAYRILVADSPELLAAGVGNVWDSKKVKSSESILLPFWGKGLKSVTKYYWKVVVWNQQGKQSLWSPRQSFVTAILDETDWGSACWVALEQDSEVFGLVPGIHAPLVSQQIGSRKVGMYKLPLLRKEFMAEKEISQATVCVSGMGHFDLFLNGEKVGDHFLDPGWTHYQKSALYVTFDVTDRIKAKNTLGVMLGNGFYNVPRERYFKQLVSFGAPKVKLCLDITYKDGTHERIITDETWRASEGPITYSSIYGGEDFDATKMPVGWTLASFDDSCWQNALKVDYNVRLRAQLSEPIKVRQALPVVRSYQNSKGNRIYDFGQNFSGIVNLKVKGLRGQKVLLRPGELLNKDSTVNQSASGGPYYFEYTLKGDSVEQWQPQFSYYGFRYIEVECEKTLQENVKLLGLHTTNSAQEVGRFTCSLPMFNEVYDLIDWSVRSNLASILTDCPHREKLGWLEVAHLMQNAMQYRYDLSGFYTKVMSDMKDSQTPEGFIPSIAPEYVRFADGFENSPEWGSAFIIIPWSVYKWYSDRTLLENYYSDMKRYMDYLATRANNHIIAYGLGDWFDLGPNHPGYSQLTSNGVTSTGIYYYNATIMAQAAALCGYEKDQKTYEFLAEQIKIAFNAKFYDPLLQQYDRNSQTANAIALHFGLVEEKNADVIYQNLVDDIKKRNYALTAGDIGYRYLLRVLEDYGDSELIYKMNTKYDAPGYGWQLAHGATALTESWQAYGFVSNNHCMLGHLLEWLFTGVGGIKQEPSSVAFKVVKIEPQLLTGLNEAATTYESPYGTIRCEWKRGADNIYLNLSIPANSEAIVYLPVSDTAQISEGGLPIGLSQSCKMIESDSSGKRKVKVDSGNYRFLIVEGTHVDKLQSIKIELK